MFIKVTRPPMEFVVASGAAGQSHVLYVWRKYKKAAPIYVTVGMVTKLRKFHRAVRADYFCTETHVQIFKYHAAGIRMLVCEAVLDFLDGPENVANDTDYWHNQHDMQLFFRDSAVKVDVAECCKGFSWWK